MEEKILNFSKCLYGNDKCPKCYNNNYTTSTATVQTSKYNDWFLNEISEFVYGANNEEDAISNIKTIMKLYDKRMSSWKLLKLLLSK